MTALVIVLIALLAIAVLGLTGVISFGRKPGSDVSEALRQLLLDRAGGRISAEEFEKKQAALHAALLETSKPVAVVTAKPGKKLVRWALPLGIAIVAVGLYVGVGKQNSADTSLSQLPPPMSLPPVGGLPGEGKGQSNSGGDLNTMVKRLADKMANDPKNGEGWLLLARTYGELRKHAEAADAYGKAAALLPPDAALLADWADAYVMSHDRKWDKESRAIVKRAVAADPKHLKALALAGSEAFDRADYKGAIEFWKRMKAAAPPDSMDAKLADSNMEEANAMISGKPRGTITKAAEMPAAGAAGGIAGTIALDPKLKEKIAPTDTIFLVAKAPDGSNPPLAAKRFKASELPIKFELDDTSSMVPGRTLSKFGEALVSARLSKSGDAIPQPGDIPSAVVRVKLGSGDVKLELTGGK